MTEIDTSREAIKSLVQFIRHNKVYEKLEDADREAYQLAEDALVTLLARAEKAEAQLAEARNAAQESEISADYWHEVSRNENTSGYERGLRGALDIATTHRKASDCTYCDDAGEIEDAIEILIDTPAPDPVQKGSPKPYAPGPRQAIAERPNDGRPMNTDEFLVKLLAHCDDPYDLRRCVQDWTEGDWKAATIDFWSDIK